MQGNISGETEADRFTVQSQGLQRVLSWESLGKKRRTSLGPGNYLVQLPIIEMN